MTDQTNIQIDEIEEALNAAEMEQIIADALTAPEPTTLPVENIADAIATANGADEALAAAAAQAADEDASQAPAAQDDDTDEHRTFADLLDAVSETEVANMQKSLAAAFADRAEFERESNPGNFNIQKTLTKVQQGHLAHGISKAMRAIGLDPNYLNKSEVAGKRRNVYALQKLQDLIYGASSGHIKNAINLAVLVSLIRCEKAGVAFTGDVAKACASDKIAVDSQLKGLLKHVHPRFFHTHPALICLHFLPAHPISLR